MKDDLIFEQSLTSTQKLRIALIGLAFIICLGTIGFMILEDNSFVDALYMTIITLSTVGFGEITPLHPAGRVFVIFLILFGVAISGYTVSVIGSMVIEGQFKEIYGRKKMESKIAKMTNHFIIAGYGRVGRQVALEFKKKKADFIVIEKDNAAVFNLYKDKVLFIQGQATDDDILRKANIESADTLISTLPNEAENVYLTLTARDMNKNMKIIARADYDDGVKKLKRAGADHVVTPHVLGGIRMAMATLRPNVVDFMHSNALGEGGLTIEELVIPDNCFFSGKSIIDSKLKNDYSITIIGIKKPGQEMSITPGPNTVLETDDILVLIGIEKNLETLSNAIR
jgi:voltage-gated potassium channel